MEETYVDFSDVRDTMYKYSKKVEERFFADPFLTFLFSIFAKSIDGQKYTRAKLRHTKKQEIKKQNSKNPKGSAKNPILLDDYSWIEEGMAAGSDGGKKV